MERFNYERRKLYEEKLFRRYLEDWVNAVEDASQPIHVGHLIETLKRYFEVVER